MDRELIPGREYDSGVRIDSHNDVRSLSGGLGTHDKPARSVAQIEREVLARALEHPTQLVCHRDLGHVAETRELGGDQRMLALDRDARTARDRLQLERN